MFRRLLAVLAVALLAASCSSSDTLATVNGEEITKDDLYTLQPSYEDSVDGLTGEAVREDVSRLIILEASIQAAADDFGLNIDDSLIEARLANPPARYASVFTPDIVANSSDEMMRNRAIVSLIIDAAGATLAAEDAGGYDALLADRPYDVAQVCVRHIMVATVEEGEAVLARLEAGDDFVEVAAEVSIDDLSPEGLLGSEDGTCLAWLGVLGEEFAGLAATAELNVPVGPVFNGSGYSVIRVEDRVSPASVADLEANVMDYLDPSLASDLYSTWVSDVVRDADVEVSSALGRWSEAGFGIAPPGE